MILPSQWQTIARNTIRMLQRRGYTLDVPSSLSMNSHLATASILYGILLQPHLNRPANTKIGLSFLVDSKPSVACVNSWVATLASHKVHVAVLVTELMPQAPAARELARLVREQSIHLQLIDATTMLIDCTSHADVPHYSILTTDQTEQLKRDLRLTDMKQLWHLSPQDPQVIYWDYPCGSVLSFIETLDSSLEGTRCFRLVVDTHPPG